MKLKSFTKLSISCLLVLAGAGALMSANQTVATQTNAAQHKGNYDSYTYSGSYYNSISDSLSEGLDGSLRTSLTSLICPKEWYSYSSGLKTALQDADEDPTNSSNMVYLYTRDSVKKNAASTWNREHTWPQSLSGNCWGQSGAGCDLLHIRPTYNTTNSTRGNDKYGNVSNGTKKTYNNMDYGTSGSGYFEPLDSVKGDVARCIMYTWVAYKKHYSNLPSITNVFKDYDTMLSWHTMDEPDVMEGNRNDYSQTSKQKNRNPFVDHPEYAWKIFGDKCSKSVKDACQAKYPGKSAPATPYISLSKDSLSLEVNNTATLTATVYNAGDISKDITWYSGDDTVASVSSSGLVTGKKAGSTSIYAYLTKSPNVTAECKVTVSEKYIPPVGGSWTLVNSISDLEIGSEYTFGVPDYKVVCSPIESTSNKTSLGTKVATFNGLELDDLPDGAESFILGGSKGAYTLKQTSNDKNLSYNEAKKLINDGKNYTWQISFSGNECVIKDSTYTICFNKGDGTTTMMWRNYVSLGEAYRAPFYLYKKGGSVTPVTKYTVTFDSQGGSSVNSQSVKEGETATRPTNPTRSGYSFLGWYLGDDLYDFSTPVTSNITLTAHWKEEQIVPVDAKVTLNKSSTSLYAGDKETLVATVTVPSGMSNEVIWSSSNSATASVNNGEITAVKVGTATITATLKADTTVSASCSVTVLSKSTPTNSWTLVTSTSGLESGATYTFGVPDKKYVCSPLKTNDYLGTVTASFTNGVLDKLPDGAESFTLGKASSGYTLKQNSNGEYLGYSAKKLVSGTQTNWTINFEKGNCVITNKTYFLSYNSGSPRWKTYTSSLGEFKLYKNESSKPADIFTVNFDSNGGSSVGSQSIVSGQTATRPETIPTKEGYTFLGWFYNDAEYNFNTPVTSNITLVAHWEANNYTVTFDTDGGSAIQSAEVSYGNPVSRPNDPTKEGYKFLGWYLDEDAYDFGNPVTSNMTLTAHWEKEVTYFRVEFETQTEDLVKTELIEEGGHAFAPNVELTKEGYTFAGWYYGNELFDFENTPITSNITLVAHWNLITCTVTFDSDGGSYVADQTVDYGELAMMPSEPTKDGHTFVGWYNGDELFDFDNTSITSNLILTAKWEAKSYIVNFDMQGADPVADQTVKYGELATEPEEPVKEGYMFLGWYLGDQLFDFDRTPVTSDMTITAKWEINTYSVTYVVDGQTYGSDVVEHDCYTRPPLSPVKEGYTFAGWYNGNELFDFEKTPITSSLTLTAKWEANEYLVTFDSQGGSEVDEQLVKYGDKIIAPIAPTREGYTFLGWYVGDELYDFNTLITKGMTLVAKWEINSYTVTFDSNGGNTVNKQIVEHGGKISMPADPTKEGYTFLGWYVGDTLYDFNTPVTGDISLTAKWEETKPQNPSSGGCGGSVMACSALISLVSVLGVCLIIKKKNK